jgi:hypothetical protein
MIDWLRTTTTAYFYKKRKRAGGPHLAIFVCIIPTEGAPSLRFLQGWAAMLLAPFDLLVRAA